MPGADLCLDYKAHEERGYKQEYTTNAEAFAAKQEFNSKTGRERRRERRKLSDEEIKRVSEQQKRQTEDEKEISRRVTGVERGRREREKEETRLRKEALNAVRQVSNQPITHTTNAIVHDLFTLSLIWLITLSLI